MKGTKKKLYLNYNEVRSLLDHEAFDKYAFSHLHVYVIFTGTSCYFHVETFDGTVLATLSNVDKLDEYFRNNGR